MNPSTTSVGTIESTSSATQGSANVFYANVRLQSLGNADIWFSVMPSGWYCGTFEVVADNPNAITINPPGMTLGVGESWPMTATPSGPYGVMPNRTVSWSSSNPAAATVSSAGIVTAVGTGLTAIGASYMGVSTSVPVWVDQTYSPPTAAITGPSVQPSNQACTWFVDITHGHPPLTYNWREVYQTGDFTDLGTWVDNQYLTHQTQSGMSYTLRLTLTDSRGGSTVVEKQVTLGSEAWSCE